MGVNALHENVSSVGRFEVENFNHVLKDGIKKLLPSSIVEYIRKKRQIRNDEHWFEQKLLPYLTDAPERSAEYEKRSQDLLSK